jgi:hypothetical protein
VVESNHEDQRDLEHHHDETDDAVVAVLHGGFNEPRRGFDVRSPEDVENVTLLSPRTTAIDVDIHGSTILSVTVVRP